jgi:hypothetical protein
VGVPVDLQGFVLQKYSSLSDFQNKLIRWMCESIPLLEPKRFKKLHIKQATFEDDFMDKEIFRKLWSCPPGSSYITTSEGLRFSYTHFPILTTTLALLRDYEFEFSARIDQGRIGWVVKGTQPPGHFLPAFCIMFNLNEKGDLRPHIWNHRLPDPINQYRIFPETRVKIKKKDSWFTLITRVRSDTIEIEDNKKIIFASDFSKEPYASIYNDFPHPKEGQVGFRCHPEEEATVKYVKVREL